LNTKNKAKYEPSDSDTISNTNISKFMKKHGLLSYSDLVRKSTENIGWYWDSVNKDLGLKWFTPYCSVFDSSNGIERTRWFIDGKCNIVSNAVDRHLDDGKDRIAYIFENEAGQIRQFSYAEIDYNISALALALKSQGIEKGDVVGIYLPMIPEAIFSILACSKIGAVHNTIFTGFGPESVATRLDDSKAKILVTSNYMIRRGNRINLGKNWKFALEKKDISKIIVIDESEPRDTIDTKVVSYDDFVLNFLEHRCETESMNSEDPLFILHTSGTTGKPKAVIHTHGGFMIVAAQQASYLVDMKENDILFWYADPGWITGQTWVVYGSPIAGGTSLLYDGILTHPTPDNWCKIIEKHNVTIFGVAPTAIRLFMRDNSIYNYVDNYNFHSLRILTTTGEPINEDAWVWYYNKVGKKRLPIINLSGGTEIGGAILATTFVEPFKPSSVGFPIPGFSASILNDNGNDTNIGYLVIKKPWPSMTRGLLNDNERFVQIYWSKFKNVWFHGDLVEFDSEGYWYITGRIDDIIKVSGHRLGSNEIESILMSNKDVSEAIAVGVPDDIYGESIICYIIPKYVSVDEKLLGNELNLLIEKKLGKFARAKYFKFVKDLPRTKSGKLVRRLVKLKALKHHITDKDLSVVDNPESIIYL
jgi:acetyl-CoA synthetase